MRDSINIKMWFLIFFIGSFMNVNGQGVINVRIKNEIERLKIDTALIYSFTCSGCSTSDSCSKERPQYLFWKQNDRFYIRRFDYCKDYVAIVSNAKNPLGFYLRHREVINNEEIKPPTFKKVVRKESSADTVLLTSSVDHSYYHELTLHLEDKIVRKSIDVYNLQSKKYNDGLLNINYDSNRKTQSYNLVNRISEFIKACERKKCWREISLQDKKNN
jgi:hypothetical protein